ncbi:MAG: D-alanyl-D-alanine carboxypeptidase [Rickettsia endosymbiont of Bryobia graminum]|nr:D-alanyl-D-alanine carboxypeptidase [Rickettsia endosymbiont of Bryobia graminum]
MSSIRLFFKISSQSINAFLVIIFFTTIVKAESNNKIIDYQIDDIINYPNTTSIISAAKQIIVMDAATGKILLEKNAYQRMAPSSMTKIMTSYIIEDKIQKGDVSVDSQFIVSEKAWKLQGSKTFVPLGKLMSLKDILYGVIIQSGNDASVVAAEGLYGSEENFAEAMNEKASELGMKDTHFVNSSGWPAENHYSTAYDLAILSIALIKNHPEFYHIYSIKDFTFGKDFKGNPITQGNRNPLLYKDVGCDGIKTGNTEEGGYGMVGSFLDNGRRYIIVINGLNSMKKRSEEALTILQWVKQNFTSKKFYNKGEEIADADVWLGVKDKVKLIVANDVSALITRSGANKVQVKTDIAPRLNAPIKAGDIVGKIRIIIDDDVEEAALLAKESIAQVGFFTRIWRYICSVF